MPYVVFRISYFVLGTWYIVLSNAERPVQNGEVGNSANGTIPYFVSRIFYFVLRTKMNLFPPTFVLNLWG